jgi:hypothetical protein
LAPPKKGGTKKKTESTIGPETGTSAFDAPQKHDGLVAETVFHTIE